jgi:hypothetical protein
MIRFWSERLDGLARFSRGVWLAIMIVGLFIGAAAYYFIVYRRRVGVTATVGQGLSASVSQALETFQAGNESVVDMQTRQTEAEAKNGRTAAQGRGRDGMTLARTVLRSIWGLIFLSVVVLNIFPQLLRMMARVPFQPFMLFLTVGLSFLVLATVIVEFAVALGPKRNRTGLTSK